MFWMRNKTSPKQRAGKETRNNDHPKTRCFRETKAKDYYEVYRDWKNKDRQKQDEENLKERIDIYCECGDEEELYSEYEEDFDSWEDALDFWEEYCE